MDLIQTAQAMSAIGGIVLILTGTRNLKKALRSTGKF